MMNSTRTAAVVLVAFTTIGVAVATTAAALGGGAAAVPSVRAADANLIERFTVRLDARCQVAVLRMRLSRAVPVGIVVDDSPRGRVPLGDTRPVQRVRAATSSISDVKIWDLTFSDGSELRPGRHRVVLRALSADRSDVLDVSEPVAYRIPRSFATAPTRCGI